MSLIELIAGVEAREATLTVFDSNADTADTLAEHFADRNVRVVEGDTGAAAGDYAVLSRDGTFVTAVAIDDLLPGRDGAERGTTASEDDGEKTNGDDGTGVPAAEDGSDDERATGGRVGEPVLDHLDETMFTSYSRQDMFTASREIEDRAWRVGTGELHAGFQTLEVLTGEANTYDRLGEKQDLDVHAYATAEGDDPTADHYTLHIGRTAELRETWFVAYDGGGYDDAKCALLAEEREPGRFYGFWSYDPETVDTIITYLRDRYQSSESADGDEGATA